MTVASEVGALEVYTDISARVGHSCGSFCRKLGLLHDAHWTAHLPASSYGIRHLQGRHYALCFAVTVSLRVDVCHLQPAAFAGGLALSCAQHVCMCVWLIQAGIMSAIPYLVMGIMIQVGGQLADLFRSRRLLSTTNTRKVFNCSGLQVLLQFTNDGTLFSSQIYILSSWLTTFLCRNWLVFSVHTSSLCLLHHRFCAASHSHDNVGVCDNTCCCH